jgi:uncharacterized protein YchJ
MQPASPPNTANLTELQSQVLQALATGATMTAAAAASNLHRTTLYHWINTQPVFNAAVREARTECYRTWHEQKQEAHALAWSTLRELLTDPKTPAAVRLRAAIVVLKNGFDSPELSQPLIPSESEKSVENVENVEFAKRTSAENASGSAEKTVESVEIVENVECAKRTPVPRSAPCPCGSGMKFKRCCGRAAPPVLQPSGSRAA